ncbi:hypothetical protein DLR72_15155 [Vibrio paracholerae]|uniref:Secreted protein n=1 Tax=Vibrio paracholerae TaxID=650003 RepID=A0ABD7FS30_9VIBR|nr:hypothetical protein DLR72_15155 [Vibrio paracholerae]
MPFLLEAAAVLAVFALPNHIVDLCDWDYESHPWLSPKASRWLCKFFPDKFVTRLPATCNCNCNCK